jgi:hypothetical protein
MANLTAINPNAIDAAAAIASNVHMAVSSGDSLSLLAGWQLVPSIIQDLTKNT